MALKFSGTSTDFALRWYDPEKGDAIQRTYDKPYATEIEFSRAVLKTKKRTLTIHPDHKPDKNGFWLNGYQADKDNRITFTTGIKDKFVISKNEIDFLFCTTNQPYASCYKIDAVHNSLKLMCKCQGIYITYTTQQDAQFIWRGEEYTHPKMSGRAFLYESEDRRHYTCGRPYGKVGFEIRDLLRRWLPNGLEIGWELSDDQKNLIEFERDNFSNDGRTIHDRWDRVFDTDELYYTEGIPFRFDNQPSILETQRKNVEANKKRLLNKIKSQKNDRSEEIVAF